MSLSTLRVGTWNILGRQRDKTPGPVDDGAVRQILDKHSVDVLCLQEVHFYNKQVDSQLDSELKRAGLEFFVGEPLSPSHLDPDAELGVGIAARFPLNKTGLYVLNNPGLRAKVRGKEWKLHDKGIINADLHLGENRAVKVLSLHLFPFFEFGISEEDDHVKQMWSELWEYVDHVSNARKVILAGDYNQARRVAAASEWSRRSWSFCVPTRATTTTGMSLDDIATNWTPPYTRPTVVPNFSDHHLVIAELALPAPMAPRWPGATPRLGRVL